MIDLQVQLDALLLLPFARVGEGEDPGRKTGDREMIIKSWNLHDDATVGIWRRQTYKNSRTQVVLWISSQLHHITCDHQQATAKSQRQRRTQVCRAAGTELFSV